MGNATMTLPCTGRGPCYAAPRPVQEHYRFLLLFQIGRGTVIPSKKRMKIRAYP